MPWRPTTPGEVPTLGYGVIDWINEYLAHPTAPDIEPFTLYPEQEQFILRWFEINPTTGRRAYRRGVLSRPRGWGKSPMLAALAICEGLGPVVPDGWDAQGQPVAVPWGLTTIPMIQLAAVSEAQTKNTWKPLMGMLRGRILDDYPGLEPLGTFVNLPWGNGVVPSRIEPITSSARSVKGNPEVKFAVLDQTEEWVQSNGGKSLAEAMLNNAAKTSGYVLESPNAYTPGENSVAEDTAQFWSMIRAGTVRDTSLFYDHREAPTADIATAAEDGTLRPDLIYVYGDSAAENGGHVDIDAIISRIFDPTLSEQKACADFLNQITRSSDSYIGQPDWVACFDGRYHLADQDAITLGFDGSIRDDSTALVACRLEDGFLTLLNVWEKPSGKVNWQVDRVGVDAAIEAAFERYNVVGFYADPAHWQDYLDRWTQKFGPTPKSQLGKKRDKTTIKVSSTAEHPFEFWTSNKLRMEKAIERFETAILTGELIHDGGHVLTEHVINARRKPTNTGLLLRKDHPKSDRKIDACIAAVLAREARFDAVALGVGAKKKKRAPARRIY